LIHSGHHFHSNDIKGSRCRRNKWAEPMTGSCSNKPLPSGTFKVLVLRIIIAPSTANKENTNTGPIVIMQSGFNGKGFHPFFIEPIQIIGINMIITSNSQNGLPSIQTIFFLKRAPGMTSMKRRVPLFIHSRCSFRPLSLRRREEQAPNKKKIRVARAQGERIRPPFSHSKKKIKMGGSNDSARP
jgi:hypothetical protein